jgi:hypothetical protein
MMAEPIEIHFAGNSLELALHLLLVTRIDYFAPHFLRPTVLFTSQPIVILFFFYHNASVRVMQRLCRVQVRRLDRSG